jgi:hypothetical protein
MEMNPVRHDSNYGIVKPPNANLPRKNERVRTKVAAPNLRAEERYRRRSILVILNTRGSAHDGLDAHRIQKIGCNSHRADCQATLRRLNDRLVRSKAHDILQ